MNCKYIGISSVLGAALMLASGAQAGDDMGTAARDWSGPYIGATLGYGVGRFDQGDNTGAGTGWTDMSGVIGGGAIGYNAQMGQFVLGVEGDLQLSGIAGSSPTVPGWNCLGTEPCRNSVDWFSTVRGRVGYAFGDFMPFVTGGVAYAGVRSSDSDGVSGTDMSKNVFGYTLGGGVEMAVSAQVSAKVEALYVDLGTAESGVNNNFYADNKFAVVRAGLNWGF